MSIYCLQLFLNKIGVQKTLQIYPQVFSLLTHAFINFSERPKIRRYCPKIFEYYIRTNKSATKLYSHQIQFIFLQKIYQDKEMNNSVKSVEMEIYDNESQIENSLRSLVK